MRRMLIIGLMSGNAAVAQPVDFAPKPASSATIAMQMPPKQASPSTMGKMPLLLPKASLRPVPIP
jgi:hypothetical protein